MRRPLPFRLAQGFGLGAWARGPAKSLPFRLHNVEIDRLCHPPGQTACYIVTVGVQLLIEQVDPEKTLWESDDSWLS